MRKINTRTFVRATRSTSREINRRILLNLVREHQPISRAELARRMGIARGMVTALVDELLAEEAIYEGAQVDRPRGRRPMMLHVRTRDRLVAAVDIRMTRTSVMLADFEATPLVIDSFETMAEPPALAAELARRIETLLASHGGAGECEGIGLVVPGMVDHATGLVLNAPQLGWRGVDLRAALAQHTDLPVHIENAPIACALAHLWLGGSHAVAHLAGQAGPAAGHERRHGGRHGREDGGGRDNFAYVIVADGVGAGLVVNGALVRGQGSTAGEFFHFPVDLEGPRCNCGARGCLEAYTSNVATVTRYLGEPFDGARVRARARDHDFGVTIGDVIARAQRGEQRAVDAVSVTARYLGVGVAGIVNALNPSQIVVGGEIADAWDIVGPIVRAGISERALTAAAAATPVIPESARMYPRLRGATALVAARAFAAPEVA